MLWLTFECHDGTRVVEMGERCLCYCADESLGFRHNEMCLGNGLEIVN